MEVEMCSSPASLYFLIQWEDRLMSVIESRQIVCPAKNATLYKEGELIKAIFGKKTFEAVICEINGDKKILSKNAKLPPKYHYDDVKYQSQISKEQAQSPDFYYSSSELQSHMPEKVVESSKLKTDRPDGADGSSTLKEQAQSPDETGGSVKPKVVDPVIGPDPESFHLTKQAGRAMSPQVLKKDFDDLYEQVRHLKKRVRELEKKSQKDESSRTSPGIQAGSMTLPPPPKCLKEEDPGNYNGHTLDDLRSMIEHQEALYNCARKLLIALFSTEYIVTHSVTGQRANSMVEPKPKFESRLYDCFTKVLKEKFKSVKDTEITLKVQAVQKSLKIKM